MKVNRASVSATRSASARSGADGLSMAAPTSGIAPISATGNGASDEAPARPFPQALPEDCEASPALIDAIDPAIAYRVANSLLRRQGMVGLLLNRTA